MDGTIVFRPLTRLEIGQIVSLELKKVEKRLSDHNIKIEVSEAAKDYLATKGYDPDYGARPLRRIIQNEVEDALSDALLSGRLVDNNKVIVDLIDGKLDFVMNGEIASSAAVVEIKPIEGGPGPDSQIEDGGPKLQPALT